MKEEVCGTCKYPKREGEEWVCDNPDGEYFSDYVGYDDHCPDYEEKEE